MGETQVTVPKSDVRDGETKKPVVTPSLSLYNSMERFMKFNLIYVDLTRNPAAPQDKIDRAKADRDRSWATVLETLKNNPLSLLRALKEAGGYCPPGVYTATKNVLYSGGYSLEVRRDSGALTFLGSTAFVLRAPLERGKMLTVEFSIACNCCLVAEGKITLPKIRKTEP